MAPYAERTWFGVAPDGSEHKVRLRVGMPERQAGGEWAVNVSLVPLENTTRNIFGIDGWQALLLAQQFAATRVGHFVEDGWKFYWERGGEAAHPSELTTHGR